MSSFDDADQRAKYAVIPKSTTAGQVVKLAPKQLKTAGGTRTVLPEEKYLENLEKLIVRDYFPELPKLKAQSDYLEAVERNDTARMRELQLRFKFAKSPGGSIAPSPAVFDPDTPGPSRSRANGADGEETPSALPHSNQEGDNEEKKKTPLDDMTVDSYLRKYTSEDNASFEELSDLMSQRHHAKLQWMYDAEKRHNEKRLALTSGISEKADEQLAVRYDPETIKDRPKELDNWAYSAHNHVLFHPIEKELTEEEKQERAKRNQRIINKSATRFSSDAMNKLSESSMARAAISHAAAMAGKVDALGNDIGVVKASALGLIASPAIVPGVEDSPLMTWGEIDGTPFRLDAADIQAPSSSTPSFKIPALPARELLAQTISDKIARRYREKRKVAMEQAEKAHKTPRFGSAHSGSSEALLSSLSPAARLLMKNKLGIKMGKPSPLTTPSPAHSKWTRSPLVRTPGSMKTPRSGAGSRTPQGTSGSSITDNLLNVSFPSPLRSETSKTPKIKRGNQSTPKTPAVTTKEESDEGAKRPKAGDFF